MRSVNRHQTGATAIAMLGPKRGIPLRGWGTPWIYEIFEDLVPLVQSNAQIVKRTINLSTEKQV
jgi:hypothetical protein